LFAFWTSTSRFQVTNEACCYIDRALVLHLLDGAPRQLLPSC